MRLSPLVYRFVLAYFTLKKLAVVTLDPAERDEIGWTR